MREWANEKRYGYFCCIRFFLCLHLRRLTQEEFLVSRSFKKEPDGAKFSPSPCTAE
jgi:hypothetical protein